MKEFIEQHYFAVTLVGAYIFQAAVQSMPEDKFEFYPWLLHTLRLLTNSLPQKYTLKGETK